jgi:hypothetical protein
MTEKRDPLPEKWRGFRKHPPEVCKLSRCAALTLPLTQVRLCLFGFRRRKELIEKVSPPSNIPQSSPEDLQRKMALRIVRAVRSVDLHGPTNSNCLERSMVLSWLLRRDAFEGELHISACIKGGRFEAHAGVELGGEVLNNGAEAHRHYARFDSPIAETERVSRAAGKAESH